MAINANSIIDSVVSLGRGAASAGVQLARRVRRDKPSSPSGPPRDVGAPNAGEPGAPRSSTSTAATKTAKPAAKRPAKGKPAGKKPAARKPAAKNQAAEGG
jgi:hypothetical protein